MNNRKMDSDMDWIQPRPKMTEDQWNVYRRPISLVLNISLIVNYTPHSLTGPDWAITSH